MKKILAKWQKTIYSIQKELFRNEVCRKRHASTEGVKLSGAGTYRCNCKWIDSLETPGSDRGPKVQHISY